MKIAVVGWCDNSGIGREISDAIRHLPISSAYIFESQFKNTRLDLLKGVNVHFDKRSPDRLKNMEKFIDEERPDVILTWEHPVICEFPELWLKKGVKWINIVHWDWFNPTKFDLFRKAHRVISPNSMCQKHLREKYDLDSTLLPIPIDTNLFPFSERKKADRFISVYSHGGPHGRRSLTQILLAWELMENPPPLTIYTQIDPPELNGSGLPMNVKLERGDGPDPLALFQSGDIAVQPSRFEGVGLSLIEAQACGLPVIAIDAPPMNEVVLPDLLIPPASVKEVEHFGKMLEVYIPSAGALRSVVERISGKEISDLSRKAGQWVKDTFSWDVLKEKWLEVIKS